MIKPASKAAGGKDEEDRAKTATKGKFGQKKVDGGQLVFRPRIAKSGERKNGKCVRVKRKRVPDRAGTNGKTEREHPEKKRPISHIPIQ